MIDVNTAYSRPEATAARLQKFGADLNRFATTVILLTGELSTLSSDNGRLCLLNSIRLLVRTFRQVHVWIPASAESLRAEAVTLAKSLQFASPVLFINEMPAWERYDAILSVGAEVRADLPWTSINAHGWLARVSSITRLPDECSQSNPMASMMASCLGVAEIFKRSLPVSVERFPLFDCVQFNLFSRKTNDLDPGPAIESALRLPLTWLVGLGAIGNGVALLIDQLALDGTIACIDKQTFGDENLGTCVLLAPDQVGSEKVQHIADVLESKGRIKCIRFPYKVNDARRQIALELPHPTLVLTGLDNIEARHDAQDLWPDLLIDGAIGDFAVQVATCSWPSKHACIKCLFPRPVGPDPDIEKASLLGLTLADVKNADAVITEEHVKNAPPDLKEFLRQNIDKRICSVVPADRTQWLNEGITDFSPSVPFVACASAALMMTAAVQSLSGDVSMLPKRYIFDLLMGPEYGDEISEVAHVRCSCQERRAEIDLWRSYVRQQ